MIRKLALSMTAIAILSLMVGVAPHVAWAANTYYTSTVLNGSGGSFYLVNDANDKINLTIPNGSLDAYLIEQGIPSVEITTHLTEEWVDTGGGTGYYRLDFVFGPSGCYFTPDEMEIELRGKYFAADTEATMHDENGEALSFSRHGQSDKITFYIPHFSEYAYDDYY